MRIRQCCGAAAVAALVLLLTGQQVAADPVGAAPTFTFAGNLDFAITGGTLRAADNDTDACALVSPSVSQAPLNLPVGATVTAAYLYWAGSGPDPDYQVTFNGQPINFPDRTFTDSYQSYEFFSGFHDVTGLVIANGLNRFADLDITVPSAYCSVAAVVAGWGLVVIYESPSEPLRVINVFDGFEPFRGSQILLNPGNFRIADVPDGKLGVLSWEGDVGNSSALNGVTENVTYRGEQQGVETSLLDPPLNPASNQFNSTITGISAAPDSTWGVDFDLYDLTPYLTPDDRSGITRYSSGGDLVLLSAQVIAVANSPVVDLTLSKSHVGNFSVNNQGVYELVVSNAGPSPHSGPITVVDSLPPELSYVEATSVDSGWSCIVTAAAAPQEVTCTHPGELGAGASLAPIRIRVNTPDAAGSVVNRAQVTGSQFEVFRGNNAAADTTLLGSADLSASTKTVVDLNGGVPEPGDPVRYEIFIRESNGVGLYGVSVEDVLDPNLTNFTVVDAAGGLDQSPPVTGPLLISDLELPPGGELRLVFEAEIAPGVPAGTAISNTAGITNPADGVVTPAAAPDLVVGTRNPPARGTKPLYLGDFAGSTNNPVLPMPLSRLPLTAPASQTRVRIRRDDDDRVWALTPVLAAPLTLSADPTPVLLQLRRNNATSVRALRVTLRYAGSGSGFIGCVDVSLGTSGAAGLSNAQTREFVFTVPQTDAACAATAAGPLTLPAGSRLELMVDNAPGPAGGGEAIYVYPYNPETGATSRAELDATTVINVDAAAVYDAAFPGGTAQPGFAPGDTFYVRGIVSDPFGSFDITAAALELVDPSGATVWNAPMSAVASDAGTKTFELAYTLPEGAAAGNWQFVVTAVEGTEGLVSHQWRESFTVAGAAAIRIRKRVTVVSDGSTSANPKFLPGALVEYELAVSNEGATAADADSIVVSDELPANLQLYLGSPAAPLPLVFEQGAPPSGLNFVYVSLSDVADDVDFSNDGGATFITPVVGADGFDATMPPINHLRITPDGVLAGDSGGGAPGFIVRLRARVR